jgi:hypothetical protein
MALSEKGDERDPMARLTPCQFNQMHAPVIVSAVTKETNDKFAQSSFARNELSCHPHQHANKSKLKRLLQPTK